MATIISPADKAVIVCFKDGQEVLSYSVVSASAKYSDFLVVLRDLTKDHAHKLTDLAVIKELGEGLSLTDGAWWYSIVLPVTQPQSREQAVRLGPNQLSVNLNWQILDCAAGYENLMTYLTKGIKTPEIRVEFQHQLQKDRDESRPSIVRKFPLIVGGPEPSRQQQQPPPPPPPPPPSSRPLPGEARPTHQFPINLRQETHGHRTLHNRANIRSGGLSSLVTNPYENTQRGDFARRQLSIQTNPYADEPATRFLPSMTGDPDPSILTPRDFVMRRFELNTDDFAKNLDPALEINQM